MSSHSKISLALIVLLAVSLLAACAPKAPAIQPTPAAPATAQPASPSPAVSKALQLSPEEAAWENVVSAARKEGRLVIYDYGLFGGDWGRALTNAFKNKYDIPVDLLITGGSSVTLEKLRVEKTMGQSVADLATAGSVSARGMIDLGVTKPVANELPVLKDKSVFIMNPLYSPGGEAISVNYTRLGPCWNTNLVKPGEIQSNRDLLNPKWKGKIVFRDPRLGSGGEPLSVTAFRYTKTLDDDFFIRLAEQKPVLSGAGYFEIAQMVARSEYAIYWAAGIDNYCSPIIKEGGPLGVAPMTEGTIGQSSTVMVLAKANHPNAAKLFANYVLTAEGQKVFHETRGAPPFRKDLPDYSPPQIANLKFEKIIPFTWEISGVANDEIRSGAMEKFFGKR